jgi:quercetin dioxygenase-like cupin family protein
MLLINEVSAEDMELFEAGSGESHIRVYPAIALNTPDILAGLEDYRPGEPEGYWTFFYTQAWYVLSGEVECTYGLPPTYDEQKVTIRAGQMVYVPLGMKARFRVIGDKPFRKVFFSMPRPKNLGFE